MVAPSRSARAGRFRQRDGSFPQAVAVLVGLAFALIGALGFLVTGFDDFAEYTPTDRLFGLALNPLQNVLHLLVGVLGIVLSDRLPRARWYGWLLAVGFGALFAFGLAAMDRPDINVLNLNRADNWLHLIAALAGLAAAVGPAEFSARRRRLRRTRSG